MEDAKNEAEQRIFMEMMQEQDNYQDKADEIHELILQEQAFNREFGQPETNAIPFEYVKSSVDGKGYLQGPPIIFSNGTILSTHVDMPSNLSLKLQLME